MIPEIGPLGFGNCRAIGICDDNDELIAGLVYNNFNPKAGTMEISGAALPGKYWATPQTLLYMHTFPFGQCRCQMVTMRVRKSDERLLRQLRALGYELVGLPRIFGRDEDGVICYLTDDAWKANKITRRLLRSHKQQLEEAA